MAQRSPLPTNIHGCRQILGGTHARKRRADSRCRNSLAQFFLSAGGSIRVSAVEPLASVGTGPSRGRPSRCFSKILAKMRLQRSVELNCSAAVRIPRKKQARVGEFFFDFVGLSVTEIE